MNNMFICNVPKNDDKTYLMILESSLKKYPLICATKQEIENIKEVAKSMECEIPEPLTATDMVNRNLMHCALPQKVIIKDLKDVLESLFGVESEIVTISEMQTYVDDIKKLDTQKTYVLKTDESLEDIPL